MNQEEQDAMVARIAELEKKIEVYEKLNPDWFEARNAHKFTDEGICIRCGEDAEEWESGCVEEFVRDMLYLWKLANRDWTDEDADRHKEIGQQWRTIIAEMEEEGII